MLLLTACTAAPSPTLSPSASVEPSISVFPDPTASTLPFIPANGVWITFDRLIRDVVLSPNGAIYVADWQPGGAASAIHRLNANGQESLGWPINLEGAPTLHMDARMLMASVCPTGPQLGPCALHRLSDGGAEAPGFPVTVPSGCFDMRVAWDSAIVLSCSDDESTQLVAVYRNGQMARGWPVRVSGFREFGVASDGRLYVMSVPKPEELRIDVFGRNGEPEPGWPVRMRLNGNPLGIGGVRPHPSGLVMVWRLEAVVPDQICLEAQRTVITVLAADGSVVPAWPVTVDGLGSAPDVATVGWSWMRLSGEQNVIVGYDEHGRVKDGWPIAVGTDDCLPSGPAPVDLLDDGRVALVQDNSISLWMADGSPMDGWPVTAEGGFAGGCQPSVCIPGGNQAVPPVVDPRDRSMYLVEYVGGPDPTAMQARVVAYDSAGQPLSGFPLAIPQLPCYPQDCAFAAPQVTDVQLTVDGRLVVIASEGLFVVQ
jgi:hypothetical protein